MNYSEAEALIGEHVKVDDPSCYLHAQIVQVLGFSPRTRGVFRTSCGPLDWTRPELRLTVCKVPPMPESTS